MTEQEIIELIKQGKPFQGLINIRILGVETEPWQNIPDKNARPDVALALEFSGTKVSFYGEIKTQITPKMLAKEIAPWLVKINLNNPARPYILICPFLSPESQRYCQENNIGFIDMCGNIFINMPGTILIQRLNQPNIFKTPRLLRDPFFGASSRVLRVLLKFPKRRWTITDIEKELRKESEQQDIQRAFQLSVSSISKTIRSLEEELLIRRDKLQIIVTDPRQLLFRWAEKYQERYKWIRKSSWTTNNPFDVEAGPSVKALLARFKNLTSVVTGATAANLIVPYVNIDRIDMFIIPDLDGENLRNLGTEKSIGPDFLFITPYDPGVFMYSSKINGLSVASDIQIYLDCYARGGRDAKQAEYLLTNSIEKQWNQK